MQILAKTEGVPLFVEEVTKAVLESGLLRQTDRGLELTGSPPPLAIPSTLQDSLMARLDRMATVKDVAQTASVIGRTFGFDLLVAISGIDPTKLAPVLDELVGAGLVFRRGTPPEARYSFKHALVQDAAYASMLRSRRQQLHQKIAEVLEDRFPSIVETEPELLARHCTEAGLLEQAIRYWSQAGDLASRRSAELETIAHCERGLALVPQLPETSERDQLELQLLVTLGP